MPLLPRLALASPSTGPEPSPASLAWLAGLADRQWRVQHFRSRACPFGTEAVGQVTGLPGRHLDSWLMTEAMCREIFARGARQADLALVEGTLDDTGLYPERAQYDCPGRLRPIAKALDLPTVALIPCPPRGEFHLPRLPDGVDAVVLDGLEDANEYDCYRRLIALTSKKPVLAAVEALPEVRAAILRTPRDQPLPTEIFDRLGESFLKFADLNAIKALARSRPSPWADVEPSRCRRRAFRVAYAMDEAFGAYFPDTLETLEALGAELVEFSPLRDESLPEAVDLVMIGCGVPDHHADALAANLSLIAALRSHVCRGQRIYSEGGGTAYLGRSMILGGRQIPGAGILPFDAELLDNPGPPVPVSRTLTRDSWLGPRGTVVRGYRSCRWRLHPGADPRECPSGFGSLTADGDISFHYQAVGGLIHLHLGASPDVVTGFAMLQRPSITSPTAR